MTRAASADVAAAGLPVWLVGTLLLAIALGSWLRGDGLGRRPLWYDEVGTALRQSGHTEAEVAQLADGSARSPAELQRRFQSARPGPLVPGMAAVVSAVTQDEPLHSPGYFVAAWLWTRGAGDGRATLRALSALASLGTLALLGVLAWRLFHDRGVVLATLALAAVSPLQIRYAQEARAYALWSLTLLATLLATHAAGARPTRRAWRLVALTFAAALYVHPLSLLLVPALLLLAADAGDQSAASRRAGRAAIALGAALAFWLPWALVVLAHREQSTRTAGWMGEPFPLAHVARSWFGVATSVLFRPAGPGGLLDGVALPGADGAWLSLGLLATLLLGAGLASVARRGPRVARRFVPALALLPFATLALADLLLGGRRSTVDRYLLPAWLALELALACTLAAPGPRARVRHALLVLVLVLGAATDLRSRPLDLWWNTEPEHLAALRALEADLRTRPAPIVLADAAPLRVLELASRLPDDATLHLGPDGSQGIAGAEWPRVVVVAPSDRLLARTRAAIERTGATLEPGDDTLAWHVVPAAR